MATAYDTFDLMVGRMTNANDQERVNAVSLRVEELRHLNDDQLDARTIIRDILDGGHAGLKAIIGQDFHSQDPRIPAANLMLSGLTRLAQKIGRYPDIKVDPPATNDGEAAQKAAQKRSRIVAYYDAACRMRLSIRQMARWTPGYGFTAFVIESREDINGDLYPHASIRDSFMAFPSQWTADQQPKDIAFLHILGVKELVDRFPQHTDLFKGMVAGRDVVPGGFGASSVRQMQHAGWSSQSGGGIEVYEYINEDGTWWVLPEKKLLLAFVPNPVKRPSFYVAKRMSFNKLTGQYDHVVGLMAAIARLNILSIIAAEDTVFAETNIIGEMVGGKKYQRGRNAFNFFTPGTTVDKLQNRVPMEMFQMIDRLERQLRLTVGYSVMDDAQSPTSWATGRGLDELSTSIEQEVQEYFDVFSDTVEALDSIRFEWDDKLHTNRTRQITGVLKGTPFSETYTPRTHIKGSYLTRRVYGAMAGFDDQQKIVAGLQLLGARVISRRTMQENLDGLEDISKENDRIRAERAEEALLQFMMGVAGGQPVDPRVPLTLIEFLPEGNMKTAMKHFWTPEEPDLSEEEMAMMMGDQPELELPGQPPDVATVLSTLRAQGGIGGGAQLLSRMQ